MHKKLWAPWREHFVTHPTPRGCIFCINPKQKKDSKNFIFMRRRHSFAMLNLYPYNNGHVMVAPNRHLKDLDQLRPKELAALMVHVRDCKKLLKRLLKPHGFNIGINEGRVAGAGFKNHLHVHIVPRWNGDTNYMPVLTDTKVMSVSLEEFYKKLTDAHTR